MIAIFSLCYQYIFSGRVHFEVCCEGTEKWGAMFLILIPTIKYYRN